MLGYHARINIVATNEVEVQAAVAVTARSIVVAANEVEVQAAVAVTA
jgi:hypothetical protein